jgi:hypothetical protein
MSPTRIESLTSIKNILLIYLFKTALTVARIVKLVLVQDLPMSL